MNPATGAEARHGAAHGRAPRPAARSKRPPRRCPAWAHKTAQGARAHPAPLARPHARESGGSRAHHDRRAGQAARRGAGEIAYAAVLHRVVRRRRQAPLRRRDPGASGGQAHPRAAPADRRGRRDHAVEFPGGDDHAQGRAGARGRLHVRLQARDADALLGARAGRARRARRHSARRVQRAHRRFGRRNRRRTDLATATVRKFTLHRLDGGRQAADGAVRRAR